MFIRNIRTVGVTEGIQTSYPLDTLEVRRQGSWVFHRLVCVGDRVHVSGTSDSRHNIGCRKM